MPLTKKKQKEKYQFTHQFAIPANAIKIKTVRASLRLIYVAPIATRLHKSVDFIPSMQIAERLVHT
jgi:hypothetical protein